MVTRTIDGVVFEFHQTPNTEAPSEMIFYLPQFGVLNMAEIAAHTAHNLLTPRGAQVRSALAWSTAVGDALDRYGNDAQVLIGQHHWPTWGTAEIRERLAHQRDFYRFVHDQSLHLANSGANMDEIGEALALPAGLAADWALQDYYGTLKGAGKAVYQFYLGWYDGNPANLQKLPAVQSAPRYVAYMGGAQQILARARKDFEAGEYRWVAEVLNQVLFAEPENQDARELQARTFEQLGYQQVSATWRHLYLMGAHELREGVAAAPMATRPNAYLRDMPSALLLDFAGIALDGPRAAGQRVAVNLTVTDTGESFDWILQDSVLRHAPRAVAKPDVVVAMDKAALAALVFRQASLAELVSRGTVHIEQGQPALAQLVDLLTAFKPDFPLVTP
jgi:alkyl sulfatase BDS1-like metallo-beta-lactamase superfamily hydrolase